MPFNYTAEEIATAMKRLVENMGETYWVSQETGISERTLRRWKSKFQVYAALSADEPQSEEERNTYERYRRIRDNLLTHIERLYQQMDSGPEQAADLAIALARLIDRLSKLESLLDNRHFSIVVRFRKPVKEGDLFSYKRLEDDDELPF